MAIRNTVEARIVGTFVDRISTGMAGAMRRVGAGIKTAAKVGVAAFAGLVGAATPLVAAANQQEQSISRMEQSLRSTGQFSKEYSQELQKAASAFQDMSTVGDEEILKVQARLVSFGATRENINQVTGAILDLAEGMEGDLKGATLLMGKALAGEFGSLSRYGIMVDQNADASTKLAQALGQIEQRFGGQASAKAQTFGGALTQLKNVVGDLFEELGFLVTKNESFRDGVKSGIETVKGWISTIQENNGELKEYVGLIGQGLVGGLKLAGTAFKGLATAAQFFIDLGGGLGIVAAKIVQAIESIPNRLGNVPASMLSIGKRLAQSLIDGFIRSLSSMGSRVASGVGSLFDQLNPFSDEKGVANRKPEASKAVGMSRIPRDMTVRVHKDEAILNPSQARRHRAGGSSFSFGDIIVQGGGDAGTQVARTILNELRRLQDQGLSFDGGI